MENCGIIFKSVGEEFHHERTRIKRDEINPQSLLFFQFFVLVFTPHGYEAHYCEGQNND
jgi:hypothetical protein